MKIDWGSITDRPTDYDYTGSDAWVQTAVQSADETTILSRPKETRQAKVHFNLMKVDDLVVVNGRVETSIKLVCSRCAKEFTLPINTPFRALYSKDFKLTGENRPISENQIVVSGRSKGWARHAHDDEDEENLDIAHVHGDHLDLSLVLGEQMSLLIPFQPLCKPDCKGICLNCGSDWNRGRCACDKTTRNAPLAIALSKFKKST